MDKRTDHPLLQKHLPWVLRWGLELIFWGGCAITASLPFMLEHYLNWFGENRPGDPLWYGFALVFLLVTAVPMLIIVRGVIGVLRSIVRGTPFVEHNATCLYVISGCAFSLAVFYAAKCFLYPSLFTVVLAMLFVILGLLTIVFGGLFAQAARVKRENDLTV